PKTDKDPSHNVEVTIGADIKETNVDAVIIPSQFNNGISEVKNMTQGEVNSSMTFVQEFMAKKSPLAVVDLDLSNVSN
ncbi:MAG: hypothetical protein ACEQSL_03335, partial [Sediminibacterium sp.]